MEKAKKEVTKNIGKLSLSAPEEAIPRILAIEILAKHQPPSERGQHEAGFYNYVGREVNAPQWVERLIRINGQYFDADIWDNSNNSWSIIGRESDVSNVKELVAKAIKKIEHAAWRAWPDATDHKKRTQLCHAIIDGLDNNLTSLKKSINDIINQS